VACHLSNVGYTSVKGKTMQLSDYGLLPPTNLVEAYLVIEKLLDRCDQLNEVIDIMEEEL